MASARGVSLLLVLLAVPAVTSFEIDRDRTVADPYETDDAGVVVDVGTDDDVSPFYEPKTSLRAISQEEAALDAERAVSDAATSAEAVLHAVEEAATGRKDVTSVSGLDNLFLGEADSTSDITSLSVEDDAPASGEDSAMARLESSLQNLRSVRAEADGLLQGAKDAVSGLTQVVDQQSAEASTLIASGADGGSSLQEVAKSMDTSADKCQDFYQYACGGWLNTTSKPDDVASWSKTFSVINKRNMEIQKEMYSRNDTSTFATLQDDEVKMVKDYYHACMDETLRGKRGLTDALFTKYVHKINAVQDAKGLMLLYSELTLDGIDIGPYDIGVGPDEKDSTTNVLGLSQAGIGLPSRDYYGVGEEPDNDRFKQVRAGYVKFMNQSFAMAGVTANPDDVLKFETELAKIMWSQTQMRDPHATYFPTTIGNFSKHHFAWDGFFAKIRKAFPAFHNSSKLILSPQPYFKSLETLLSMTSVATLKGYALRRYLAQIMPATTVDAGELNFEFYGRLLKGVTERPVLWKRCVSGTTEALWGMADRMFVEKHFTQKSKDLANTMLDEIIAAFQLRLDRNQWMDADTKTKAKQKLANMSRKIGYPDSWRGYIGLEVTDNYLKNMLSSWKVELARNFKKMGEKVDNGEWHMHPSMTNAYYAPNHNEMAFPAGILQPPFFNADQPSVLNFGSIGAVMGHELTHGFDDQGAEFNAKGDMQSWWSDASHTAFGNKTSCISQQYEAFPIPELAKAAPKLRIDGKLTMGENIADNGGVVTALDAYNTYQKKKDTPTEYSINGTVFPAKSLFWVAYAQSWCQVGTPEHLMVQIRSDPHSPPRARVDGPVQNTPDFSSTMQCAAGAPMNPNKKCDVW